MQDDGPLVVVTAQISGDRHPRQELSCGLWPPQTWLHWVFADVSNACWSWYLWYQATLQVKGVCKRVNSSPGVLKAASAQRAVATFLLLAEASFISLNRVLQAFFEPEHGCGNSCCILNARSWSHPTTQCWLLSRLCTFMVTTRHLEQLQHHSGNEFRFPSGMKPLAHSMQSHTMEEEVVAWE